MLGIGGVRALRALGIAPAVWHLNEGHAAFVVLQRMHELLSENAGFDAALDCVRRATIFTTHTPVAAGHDAFPLERVEHHLSGAWGPLSDDRARFLALGEYDNQFNMTALALRTAGWVNGVSKLHGEVTYKMWTPLLAPRTGSQHRADHDYQRRARAHVAVARIPPAVRQVSGPDWADRCDDPAFWSGVRNIPDEELWRARTSLKRFLFAFIRQRARDRWAQENVSAAQVVASGPLLDPGALTIGFARRFTAYKRPELIFRDPDRLIRILSATRRHVQIVFAGKSHPADDAGKNHLQHIYRHAIDPIYGGRIAFVDDYDMHVAHFLTQGCDVWLNTPRKPLEASGTSGMKAAINGVPHLSIGDGWWAEGYNGSNGWLIDGGAPGDDQAAQDAADADALYRLLEEQVVPTYYQRDDRGIPHAWLQIVRESIRTATPQFSALRMVKQYVDEMYAPAAEQAKGSRCLLMPRKSIVNKSRCALCGAKDVSEPRGDERYCRDCWDKKIAIEEIVAREFALKRYIRAHSAEKYLVYHSTVKRPCGQLIVVDDGYDLFLTIMLYPNFGWDEPAYHLEGDPEGRTFAEILVDVVATEVIEPWGGGKWHLEIFRSVNPEPEDWNGEM